MRLFAFLLLISIGGAGQALAQSPSTTLDRKAIEEIVREVIRKDPQIIVDALKDHEKQLKLAEEERAKKALVDNREALRKDPNSVVIGAVNGDVTVIEFFDYRCPYCRRAYAEVQGMLRRDPKVRVMLKELPILGPESVLASRAAIAARAQGKYEELHNAMLEVRSLNEAVILRLASDIGLDMDKLKADMARPEVDKIITDNRQMARALGITGTPAFIIGDEIVPGVASADQLLEMVQDARGACRTC